MHDLPPTYTDSDLEALSASEVLTLLSKCQAELGRRGVASATAVPAVVENTDRSSNSSVESVVITESAKEDMTREDEKLIRDFYSGGTGEFVFEIDAFDA